MKSRIEEVFDELFRGLASGKDIGELLKEYPEYAEELRPLLEMALRIKELPKPEPEEKAVLETIHKVKEVLYREKKVPIFKKIFIFQPTLIRVFALIILIVIISGTGLLFSSRSMPNEILYPAKRLTEKIQYSLTFNQQGKVELHIRFAERRADELMFVFNKNKKINEDLLSAMLNETENAFHFAEVLGGDRTYNLLKRIAEINQEQISILEGIKNRACPCDTILLNQALDKCKERCQCIEYRLNRRVNQRSCPSCSDSCTCW
ncbi:MAG: DUF5667 domain-containing protein [bacterium]